MYIRISLLLFIIILLCILQESCQGAAVGSASWYSLESCYSEGTSGIMANGRRLNDEELTCASWDYRFGTILLVKNLSNGKSARVTVTDRGPSKKLYRNGRIIDLSKKAFSQIANLKQGIIKVSIERIY